MNRITCFLALLVMFFANSAAPAGIVPHSFETMQITTGGTGSYSLANNSILTDLTRPGATFDFKDCSLVGAPTSWGTRCLSPFINTGSAAFVISLSDPVNGISIDMGDFDPDTDDLAITAFSGPNATGTNLGTVTGILSGGNTTFVSTTITASFVGALSFRFKGGAGG